MQVIVILPYESSEFAAGRALMIWPWLAALVGMLGYGVGAIIQSISAKRRGGPTAMFQPLYLLGVACDGLAWIGALVALQRLPLFTVQAILAGSLAVTVLLARVFLGATLARRDILGISIAGLGLLLVAGSSGTQSLSHTPSGLVWAMTVGFVVIAGATLVVYRRGAPMLLAALSGLAFAGGALGGRALSATTITWATLTDPLVWLMIAYALLALFAFSRSLEFGEVGSALAVMWIVDVIVPGIIGVFVLGDTVRTGAMAPAIIGVLLAVAAGVLLAGTAGRQSAGARKVDHPATTAIP